LGDSSARRAAKVLREDYGDGARLLVVQPDGGKRQLAADFHSASDPEVSFDGLRLLFAGKRTAQDPWDIFEIGVDGSGLRQITQGLGDCRNPIYQSRFYQISDADEAWYQILFLCSRPGVLNESGSRSASAVYSCRLDGTDVRRVTFNLSSDYDQHLMWDGRLAYSSWRRRTLEDGLLGRVVLLEANAEGTDPAPLCVESGKRIKHMACDTAGGLVVFVEADRVPWDGAGLLSCVTTRRPLHTYRPITDPADGLFHSPSPLPDGRILVSRRPADGSGTHGVYRMDPVSKRIELAFDDPEYHDIDAKLVAARREPDGRSSPSIDTDPNGKIYCLNVYMTDFPDKTWLPPGTVKKLRLLEGVPRQTARAPGASPTGKDGASPTGKDGASPTGKDGADSVARNPGKLVLPQLASRRVLGEVPVAPDGSFNVEVPANTPIELQLVDESGLALRSCGWVSTRNHFNQGCIGCHEDPELTPENFVVDALKDLSVVVAPPVEQRRSIDFRRDVMPIVARNCLPCHCEGKSPPNLTGGKPAPADPADPGLARIVYDTLLEPATTDPEGDQRGRYVDPGRARTSTLVWHVFGKNSSRPWDGEAIKGIPKPIPPDAQPQLSDQEKAAIAEWIDLGAPWDSSNW